MTQMQEAPTKTYFDPSLLPLHLAASPSGLAMLDHGKSDPETGNWSTSWIHAKHTAYLNSILLDLASRKIRDAGYVGVIIEEPPRVGKSELTSHYFPAYYLGTYPDDPIMLASYEADFAASWGRKVRDTVDKWGKSLYGIEVSNSSSAANRWALKEHKGGMMTAGVGGSFTGRGAKLLLVDDPIKNAKEADSETIRDAHYSWWKTTARTRLEPDGIICLIMTRWHEDDLAGRLIKDMEDPEADQFLVVRLPMVAEEPDEEYPDPDPLGRVPGELLFPEKFGWDEVTPIMSRQDRTWFALYQQRPTTIQNMMIDPAWFEVIDRHQVPPLKKTVRRWDMAATEEGEGYDPDYTVGAKVGLSEDGCLYILDIARFRKSPGDAERAIKGVAAADSKRVKITMEQEPGSSGKTVIHNFRRRVLPGYAFRGERSTGDKILRAEILASRAQQGDVKVVKAPWNSEFFSEVRKFRKGAAHDDQVDAVSGALDDLTKKGSGKVVTW